MLYLLDANALIDADRDYYPIARVPEFWDWLVEMGQRGSIKVPEEIYEEIVLPLPIPKRPNKLVDWIRTHQGALLLNEQVNVALVADVTERGYAVDLTDVEVEKVGRDPFLIAYALAGSREWGVVTTERSKPSRTRANRHLPDVCGDFNVRCIDTFTLIRDLNFHTNRRRPP